MCYYILFKMSVKEFTLKMPEWSKPEVIYGEKVMSSRIKAFINFTRDIIEWLKAKQIIDKKTADAQILKLEDQKTNNYTIDPFIQNLTNIPGAITNIESRASTFLGNAGDVRTITDKKGNSKLLQFTNPEEFNETMFQFNAAPEVIDMYGSSAGRKEDGKLFPKETTYFLMTIDARKIPNNYSPDQYPTMRPKTGGHRKSRKLHKKRYTRKVASRKYRNRK